MSLLTFDWGISLESFARVAFWSIVFGFFFAIGSSLWGWVPFHRRAAT